MKITQLFPFSGVFHILFILLHIAYNTYFSLAMMIVTFIIIIILAFYTSRNRSIPLFNVFTHFYK